MRGDAGDVYGSRGYVDSDAGFLRGKRHLILDRDVILRRIPHYSRARRYSRHSIAAAFTQFEFICGKIRQIHKGGVPESDNFLWKGIASARDSTIPPPLSPRTKSTSTRHPRLP